METLVKQRGIVKAKLTRASKIVEAELDVFLIDTKLENLAAIETEFEAIQQKIEILADDQAAQEAERDSFEQGLLLLKAKLRKIKSQLTTISTSTVSLIPPSVPTTSHPAIKLPKLNLTTFSGKWDEWSQFHELFNELVHKNDTLSSLQKFYYLRSSLTGDAASSIQSLQLTEANYDEAWSLLTKRYDNKRLIVNHHLKAIFDLPTVPNENALRAFVDSYTKNIRALKALGRSTDNWDDVLTYLLASKLSPGIRRQWELTQDDVTSPPVLKEFITFLEQRAAAAEMISQSSSKENDKKSTQQTPFKREIKYSHLNKTDGCVICKGPHFGYQCPTYNKANLSEREKLVSQYKLCYNCLNPNHTSASCRSSGCRKCSDAHHTSLHPMQSTQSSRFIPKRNSTNPPQTSSPQSSNTITSLTSQAAGNITCLPTASVKATDGVFCKTARMIIDCGSQCTIITEHLARSLRLARRRVDVQMEGIGGATTTPPHFAATLKIASRNQPHYELEITAKILPFITGYTPQVSSTFLELLAARQIPLADDFQRTEKPVDILLGGEYWAQVMQPGKLEISANSPPLIFSSFGWLVSGNVSPADMQPTHPEFCNLSIETQLRKFWELEEPPSNKPELSATEQFCEELFAKTTKRDETGRYVVKLPFNEQLSCLGESRTAAERQFFQIERRINNDPRYGENYRSFLHEYESLGHMTKVLPTEGAQYYLPHHAVSRPDDNSKFRVVFNGSKQTSTGISLNQALHVGPTVQNDLFTILCRFRAHKIAVVTDVEKMYRQILVDRDDRKFQQIVWRENPSMPLSTYELNTITYGLACAPYLATRCLKQLALDEGKNFPAAANALLFDDYVDDILSGAESLEKALELVNQLQQISASAQFNLRKWHSNDATILQQLTDVATPKHYTFDSRGKFSKALGLLWESASDTFVFHADFGKPTNRPSNYTKRELLSQLSKIFDPLGLLAPIVIVAKCLLQGLWLQPITWDTPIADEVQAAYNRFIDSTENLTQLRIPRHVYIEPQVSISLHGFSDASERAYAACIYVAVVQSSGETLTSLLCAKTRVAPLKTVSVPRLELCGAALLTRTFSKVAPIYNCPIESCFAYSDSAVVLTWLSKPSGNWKTFVANRVSEITTSLPAARWRHVSSEHNSADIASRGATVESLVNYNLWWNPPLPPPVSTFTVEATAQQLALKEQRPPKVISLATVMPDSVISILLDKNFRYSTLIRVFAYVLRAAGKFRKQDSSPSGHLTTEELAKSRTAIIKHVQQAAFPETLDRLRTKRPLKRKDRLNPLAPFLDGEGILRVGGRLPASLLSQPAKHPILLPSKSRFTTVLLENLHATNFHTTTNTMITILRQQFWVINARDTIRRLIHRCQTCRRLNATSGITQPTGNLPAERVRPSRQFSIVGLDFGGPVTTRYSLSKARNVTCKSYIALFVCFSTKAVHIELVSSLTTDAFLAAFDRFTGRRGYPSQIFSDNGTNFVGASRKLTEIDNFLRTSEFSDAVHRHLVQHNITWQFIPPRAPNFGGLWEAGIKCIKKQLTATVKTSLLTYEEINTALIQIEACLNSRPLTAISTSPNDEEILTPSHFYTGESIKTPPTLQPIPDHLSLTKRWRLVQALVKTFWERWSKEYVTQLQEKNKTAPPKIVEVNDIVLIKDDATPPMKWPLARVIAVHPGADGVTRVATLKTATSEFKRAVSKLVPIPTAPDG